MNAMLLLAVAAVLLAAGAQAQFVNMTTQAQRYKGFTYASNVIGYNNMTLDYCDMKTLLAAGNYTGALDLYINGKNSARGAGKRPYQLFTSHVATGELAYVVLMDYHKNASFLDNAVRKAIADEDDAGILTLLHISSIKYMLHEVDEAGLKTSVNLTDDISGAPHNLDEAWALWSGQDNNCGTLQTVVDDLAADLGLETLGKASLGSVITGTFNDLQFATRKGNSTGNAAAFNASRTALHTELLTMALQGIHRNAYAATVARKCKRTADAASAKSAAVAYYQLAAPLLASRGAGLNKLDSVMEASPLDYKKAAAALVIAAEKVGIPAADLGVPKFAKINVWGCSKRTKP